MNIKITIGDVVLKGTLGSGEGLCNSTPEYNLSLYLPMTINLSRWGDEYYGTLPVPLGEFDCPTSDVMEVGDLAYWEPGEAFCIFFGPTPASDSGEPRAASPVNKIGRVFGNWNKLRAMTSQVSATIESEDLE